MIGKDYFKRQATTLRKMVSVVQDQAVATRLTFLADHFEAKADQEADQSEERNRPSSAGEGSGRH